MLSQNGKIEGIDVSQYQDYFNTAIKPDLQKAVNNGAKFCIIRGSYGVTQDVLYQHFLQTSLPIGYYHYMDYYSYPNYGVTPAEWGKRQGKKIIELLNGRDIPVFIDVESASVATNIANVWGTAMTILDNILSTVDTLGRVTGIYASTGWLKKFYSYHKFRPLWAANFNKTTPENIRKIVSDAGWSDLVIWQYGSHGDINGDGISDGKLMGMESDGLDLNLWMKTVSDFNEFFRQKTVVQEENFLLPIEERKFYISQLFGMNPSQYPTSRGHNGIDFGLPVGNKIFATKSGKVSYSNEFSHDGTTDGKVGYGRHVRIEHPDGSTSIYGHLSKRLVQKGETVKAGQLIGLSGGATSDRNSGFSTGPHLHFEIRKPGAPQIPGGYVYNAIDPLPIMVSKTPKEKPLYQVKVKIDNLNVRKGPDSSYGVLKTIGNTIVDVFEEQGSWVRISELYSEWISVYYKSYTEKVGQIPVEEEPISRMKTIELMKVKKGRGGLRVRSSSSKPGFFSTVTDNLSEGTEVEVLERVASEGVTWVRIGYRQWVCEREGSTAYLE